jgi:hypothetical protein
LEQFGCWPEKPGSQALDSQPSGPFRSISASLSPFGWRVEYGLDDVGRQAGQRQQPAGISDRHALLLGQIDD